jgi:5-methyltetrahydrofolate--homocysteine methyltransferase
MTLRELLASGAVLTDGAWGTELQKLGLAPGECPDTWNRLHPDRVANVAQAYVDAGSRVILTNTFRANRVTLAGHGLAASAAEINRAGVRLSRDAAGSRAKVFASIGPTGKVLAAGEIGADEVRDAFTEQAEALAGAGADALLIETMSDPGEAVLALAGARKTGLPVVVSFTFDTGRNKDRTMTGATPEAAARRVADEGADAVGANCGLGIADYVPVCRRLRASTTLPVWIKPNAGLPEMEDGRTVYRVAPAQFAECVPALVEAGADFIGGCCGTGPEFIQACAGVLARLCGSS